MRSKSKNTGLDQYEVPQKLKDQIAFEVLYEGKDPEAAAQEYKISSVHTVYLWVRYFKKRIEEGLITLPSMEPEQNNNLKAVQKRNKELEKALETANVLVYALNSIIETAEKEFNIPIRKKRGTKQ